MNKKGGIFIGVIFALFFFMIGMVLVPLVKDGVSTQARTDIGCTNSSISDGAKGTCLIVDVGIPYLMVVILTFVGGFIGSRL